MRKKTILIAAILLFVLFFPLVAQIDFFQNDDWVYYEMVSRFMEGDFTLHPYTGPTFYTQGVIAAGFAKLFGIAKLPLLTLVFAVLNFYLFTRFLTDRLQRSVSLSLLLGLVFFFNPLNIYLILGFMTAQYFILFLLVSLWFYSFYKETEKFKYLIGFIITVFLGLVVRQVALFIPLGIGIYNLLYKKLKVAGIFLVLFGVLYYYYSNIFPLSPRILEVPLQFHHLTDFDYLFALVFGVLIVVTAYTLPVVFGSFDWKRIIDSKFSLFFTIIVGVTFYFAAINFFNPHEISWGEFPYFENTLERTGFYARGLGGTKYQFKWNYDLYYYWDMVAKVIAVGFISYILFFKKKFVDEYFMLIATYLGMLVVTETFYDRYIFILLPIVLIYLAKNFLIENLFNKLALFGFVTFLALFSYQLSNDFVAVNKYVWTKATELVESGIPPEEIQATNAWKLTYRNQERDYLYNFSFDSQEVNEDYANLYTLVEEKEITFPGNIFVNPKVYLYKLN